MESPGQSAANRTREAAWFSGYKRPVASRVRLLTVSGTWHGDESRVESDQALQPYALQAWIRNLPCVSSCGPCTAYTTLWREDDRIRPVGIA